MITEFVITECKNTDFARTNKNDKQKHTKINRLTLYLKKSTNSVIVLKVLLSAVIGILCFMQLKAQSSDRFTISGYVKEDGSSDALKSVELTIGGFPARYSGRLSSVLEMNMKEGNKEKWHGEGGIGLISSRLTVEGPLKRNST